MKTDIIQVLRTLSPCVRGAISCTMDALVIYRNTGNKRHSQFTSKDVRKTTLYGMGEYRYRDMTGCSSQEAKAAINGFYMTYPSLRDCIKQTHKYCYDHGYVRSLLGRYFRIPGIRSADEGTRKYAERQSFNFRPQGGTAEIIKMGMLLCHRDERLKELGVTMIMQVHDELLFNVPEGTEAECKGIIENYVSKPYAHFGVSPLIVETPGDIGFGKTWQDAKG